MIRARVSAFAVVLLGALVAQCAASQGESVPVYIWETTGSSDIVPALGHINSATFNEILLEKLAKDPFFIIFAEHNLSPEDFIEHDDVQIFSNLAKLSAKVSYLPLVENPVGVVKELPNRQSEEVSLDSILESAEVPTSRVLIVNLNDARDDESRVDMLKRHDSSIVRIFDKMVEEYGEVLAILTGYHSSWIIPEDIRLNRVARKILAAEEENVTNYLYTEKIMIYMNNRPQYWISDDKQGTLKATGLELVENDTYELKNEEQLKITFTVNVEERYWSITELQMDGNPLNTFGNTLAALSYHCTNSNFTQNKPITKEESRIAWLHLPGLQMQVFKEAHRNVFGNADDCVGFTTIPIWSGLFVTFILALIMTAGLIAMMDIKTMDRFDDPKGKTIIINAAE